MTVGSVSSFQPIQSMEDVKELTKSMLSGAVKSAEKGAEMAEVAQKINFYNQKGENIQMEVGGLLNVSA